MLDLVDTDFLMLDANGRLQDPYPKDLKLNRLTSDKLTTLEHCPKIVKGDFNCTMNLLTSLKHCPTEVHGIFHCGWNQLTSLEGCASWIKDSMNCVNMKCTSLKGIHHHIKYIGKNFYCGTYQYNMKFTPLRITSHVLGLMKIEGLKEVIFNDHEQVQTIINKHLLGNVNGSNLGACQDELEEAGLEAYAQL